MPLLLTYNIAITGVVCILIGISLYNLRRFARLGVPEVATCASTTASTLVSILVPARNEERCIEACIRSLCLQGHANTEVLVLNDGSADATPDILRGLTHEFSNLRVIHGEPLPKGWVGKSWACHQLSMQARGEVLLFTDADTIHQPHTLEQALAFIEKNNVSLLSLVPYQILGTLSEHVVIPMVHVLYFAYVPNDRILQDKRVSISAANGQFMCFTRAGYDAVRGHTSVKNSLVEDVFLAKEVKRAGLRVALADGTNAVSCRMYTSAAEVTRGFSKNFFPATNYNLPTTVIFLAHLLTTYVLPLPMFFYGIVQQSPAIMFLSGAQLLLAGVIRYMISVRFSMPLWHVFLQPLTGLWTVVIGINSIRWAYSSVGAQWKGRSYNSNGTSNA